MSIPFSESISPKPTREQGASTVEQAHQALGTYSILDCLSFS